MGKVTGFKEFGRVPLGYRPSEERKLDYLEIYSPPNAAHLQEQSARCMDCGVPFCQSGEGCPLRNAIPEWNHLAYEGDWASALIRLEQTNNFPEFTGRVCPAPCESACVLGIQGSPVTIREIEYAIAEYGWESNLIQPLPAKNPIDKSVGIVGSGPAGLAAAQQLARSGFRVKVYERDDLPGGLLTYGIPNMKLDKRIVARRLQQMEAEGVEFLVHADVGRNVAPNELLEQHDAILIAVGAGIPRDIPVGGRDLSGVHFAMEYLTAASKSLLTGLALPAHLDAKNRHVIVIGAGDTATDCIATAVRQDCASIVNLEIAQKPPDKRSAENPWPTWPKVLRQEYGHFEALGTFGDDPRRYHLTTRRFLDNGRGEVAGVEAMSEGVEMVFLADLVLIAAGFTGPEAYLLSQLGLPPEPQGGTDRSFSTNHPKVFLAGDCRRGQSLVVWAIEEGRSAAAKIKARLLCS